MRTQKEKRVEEKLGRAIGVYEKEKNALQRINNRISDAVNSFLGNKDKPVTVSNLRQRTIYISHLEKLRTKKEEDVNKEKENVDKVREELLIAVRERKIIENLKEKRYMEYVKEQNRKEQKTIDELVSYKSSFGGKEVFIS